MEERLKAYLKYVKMLKDMNEKEQMSKDEIEKITSEMLIQIEFFQHERMVHLIVTVTFAILTLLSLLGGGISGELYAYIFTVMFLVLLIPYIRHYYILENGVQKLYDYYDKLRRYV